MGDEGERYADQSVIGVPAGIFDIVKVEDGIHSFRSASLLCDLFEFFAFPRQRRIEPRIRFRFYMDERAERAFRLAVGFARTGIFAENVNGFSVRSGHAFRRAAVHVLVLAFVELVMPHPRQGRAQRRAVFVETNFVSTRRMRGDGFAVFGKGDDRNDSFGVEIFAMGVGIVVAVSAKKDDLYFHAVFLRGLQESIDRFQRQSVVAFVSSGHDDLKGKIVTVASDDQMAVSVAENKRIGAVVAAPFGGRTRVEPVVLAFVNAFLPARASRFSVCGSGGRHDGAVSDYDCSVQIVQEAGFDGRDDGRLEKQVFQDLLESRLSRRIGLPQSLSTRIFDRE